MLGQWGKGKPRILANNWREPMKWNAEAAKLSCGYCEYDEAEGELIRKCRRCSVRPKVFPSLCDWLDDEVPAESLVRFLGLIHDTPNLDWLLLTKRPELFIQRMEAAREPKGWPGRAQFLVNWVKENQPPQNVWVGASVEDQPRANERIPELLKIPAKIRFLSVEPMLGPIVLPWKPDFRHTTSTIATLPGIDWVIVGGESGTKARPCNLDWIRSVVRQCAETDVPCYVKQMGSKPYEEEFAHTKECWNEHCALSGGPEDCNGTVMREYYRFTHPKGGDPAEWPEDLRVRQMPEVER